ncbi:MAG TPA: hypothetical protein VI172_05815 [Candidatus Dormibacteraeota bacterium]|jgi:hypothetical protein
MPDTGLLGALTLFDLAALTPDKPNLCRRCQQRPATSRVYAVRNLLGLCPRYLFDTWFRDVVYRADSGPSCDNCAWYLASAWWNPTQSCPHGSGCALWAHTLTDPHPDADCTRCHREREVVWLTPLEVTA